MDHTVLYITDMNTYRPPGYSHSTLRVWIPVFLVACVVYFATAQRGVSWQDSGLFQVRVLTGDYSGNLGLALAHPLYIAAAKAFASLPLANPPALINAFSGLGMAIALANLAALIFLLTDKRWIAFTTAAMLGLAHTIWWLSTIAEVYTWSVAGLTAELWFLVLLIRRPSWLPLCGLAFASGLGLAIHDFALLPLPVYLAVVVWLIAAKRLRAWTLAPAVACYALGAGLFLFMIYEVAHQSGLVFAIKSALFGEFQDQVLNVKRSWAYLRENAAIGSLNFVNILLPLALVGWWNLKARLGKPTALALGAVTAIEIVFVARYSVPDQFTFLLPSLVLIAAAAAVGMDVLTQRSKTWQRLVLAGVLLSIIAPPILYGSLPSLATRLGAAAKRQRVLPYRDELRYWLVPWKNNETSAQRFATEALQQAMPNGIIIADSTSETPLLALQLLGPPSNVAVQSKFQSCCDELPLPIRSGDLARVRSVAAGRTIWVVAPIPNSCPKLLLDNATFTKQSGQVLYSLQWRNATSLSGPAAPQ